MEKVKLGDYIEKISIKASSLEDFSYLEPLGVSNTEGITKTGHIKSEDLSKYLYIEEGYFAYNPYRVNVGSIGLTPKGIKGLVSPAYIVFKTSDALSAELLLDFLKSFDGLQQINKLARGTVRKALRYDDLCNIELIVPPVEKQNQILKIKKNTKQYADNLKQEIEYQQKLLKKLKQSILKEAIEGKLTAKWREQNPNIESASILLEKIKAEKEQLIKDKKIKKSKPLPEISEDEIPFEIPSSWEWCRFGDIALIKSNLVNPKEYQNYIQIGPDLIEKNTGKLIKTRTVKESEIFSSNHFFYKGQLIYSKVRPKLNKIVLAEFDGLCSADMYPIQSLIHSQYLKLVMLSEHFYWEVDKFDNRVKMPKINQNQLNTTTVPIPSLEEQKQIVKKIENLFTICDELEEQINRSKQNTQTLMQAVLKEAFANNKK